jgi:hypothetical protein
VPDVPEVEPPALETPAEDKPAEHRARKKPRRAPQDPKPSKPSSVPVAEPEATTEQPSVAANGFDEGERAGRADRDSSRGEKLEKEESFALDGLAKTGEARGEAGPATEDSVGSGDIATSAPKAATRSAMKDEPPAAVEKKIEVAKKSKADDAAPMGTAAAAALARDMIAAADSQLGSRSFVALRARRAITPRSCGLTPRSRRSRRRPTKRSRNKALSHSAAHWALFGTKAKSRDSSI